ncbi:hypothetical protein BD779DRAFT_1455255, partial [Infundibulicybe gibba]
SDIPLYGSSTTTGGVFRGKALGNVPNQADFPQMRPAGRVYVFASSANPADVDPYDNKPTTSIKHEPTRTIKPVLQALHKRFAPIQSKFISFCIFYKN